MGCYATIIARRRDDEHQPKSATSKWTVRALLARKAKAVGRKALLELETIVSPDTLMRWHRELVAQKWDYSSRRGPGRPGIMREISQSG